MSRLISNNKGFPRRPRDLAVLLLAAGKHPPRERARDQKADRAGFDLRAQALARLAEIDPEPDAIEAALAGIVREQAGADGGMRAICAGILEDWRHAAIAPAFAAWLVDQAHSHGNRRGGADGPPR